MRSLTALVATLAIVAAGCASGPRPGSSLDGVPVPVSSAGHPLVPKLVFKQLVAAKRKVLGESREKIHSPGEGLAVARAVSLLPIVAVTEQDGWFFYATAVFTDDTTHQPTGFVSGLAIRRGSKQVLGWSIW